MQNVAIPLGELSNIEIVLPTRIELVSTERKSVVLTVRRWKQIEDNLKHFFIG